MNVGAATVNPIPASLTAVMMVEAKHLVYDVLVIGGGPAGLSTAGHLVRSAFRVVVFDSGKYRNSLASNFHGIPGWDHDSPAAIRERMQRDLLGRYSKYVSIIHTDIAKIVKTSEYEKPLFVATEAGGQDWRGRKVVLAPGVSDILPSRDIKGYDDCWVRGIFQCLTSQGLEKKGDSSSEQLPSAGVLAVDICAAPPLCLRLAAQAKRLVSIVRLYTNGNTELAGSLTALVNATADCGIVVEGRKIVRLSVEEEGRPQGRETSITVVLEDGTEHTESFLVHKPTMKVNGPFAEQLGLKMLPHIGHDIIHVEAPFNQTSVEGVFAVGDCASPHKVYAQALAMGACAAAGIGAQLMNGG